MIKALQAGASNRRYVIKYFEVPIMEVENGLYTGTYVLDKSSTPDMPMACQELRLDSVELFIVHEADNSVQYVKFSMHELTELFEAITEIKSQVLPPISVANAEF